MERIGRIQKGFFADLIAVQGNPAVDISRLREVPLVLFKGKIVTEVP
jgi:imidazolonepropionase-like amidohydrolase